MTSLVDVAPRQYGNHPEISNDVAADADIDDVIEPRNTRFRIIRALQTLQTKKDSLPPKKHSNIPL